MATTKICLSKYGSTHIFCVCGMATTEIDWIEGIIHLARRIAALVIVGEALYVPVFSPTTCHVSVYVDIGEVAVENGASRVYHSVGHGRTNSCTETDTQSRQNTASSSTQHSHTLSYIHPTKHMYIQVDTVLTIGKQTTTITNT